MLFKQLLVAVAEVDQEAAARAREVWQRWLAKYMGGDEVEVQD